LSFRSSARRLLGLALARRRVGVVGHDHARGHEGVLADLLADRGDGQHAAQMVQRPFEVEEELADLVSIVLDQLAVFFDSEEVEVASHIGLLRVPGRRL
jgi:hypothetical protein